MVQLFTMLQALKARFDGDEGVTAVEYSLIAALIAVAIITAVYFLGGQVSSTFNHVGGAMSGTQSS